MFEFSGVSYLIPVAARARKWMSVACRELFMTVLFQTSGVKQKVERKHAHQSHYRTFMVNVSLSQL